VGEYGLGVPSIVVYAAAEPKRLQVTGAALAVGAAPSPGEDQAAKSFFEDLLRRGRLKIPGAGKGAAATLRAAAPQTHETHTHELRRGGKHKGLRPGRIDCGLAHPLAPGVGACMMRGGIRGPHMADQCRASTNRR